MLLHKVCVDFYCSEEDMYRDEEEIEREKILLCETNSSGTIELREISNTVLQFTLALMWDVLTLSLPGTFVDRCQCAVAVTYLQYSYVQFDSILCKICCS